MKLKISVTAGEPGLREKVTITDRSVRVKTVALTSGSASVKLTRVSMRTHTYRVHYPGNTRVSPATATARIRVR